MSISMWIFISFSLSQELRANLKWSRKSPAGLNNGLEPLERRKILYALYGLGAYIFFSTFI
jgi:hypothetical protein